MKTSRILSCYCSLTNDDFNKLKGRQVAPSPNKDEKRVSVVLDALRRKAKPGEQPGGGGANASQQAGADAGQQAVPATVTDQYLLEQFHAQYPPLATRVTTAEQVRKIINISPEVREWYVGLREDVATVSSLPDSMQAGGCTPEMWRAAQKDVEAARVNERSWANETAAASQNFKKQLDNINVKRTNFYRGCSPLVVIARYSQEMLSLETLVDIALTSDPVAKQQLVHESVARAQTEAVRAHLAGTWTNPFA